MQLVILAAGMGSRFGGLKQMEPMDEAGNFLLDYSVYDAKRAGFDSVVFIIKKDFYEDFKNSIGKRVEKLIKVDYAFQQLDDLPEGFSVPKGREKPWGTAHAIYAARNYIHDDFIIINGDDFYGRDTYKVAFDYLTKLPKDSVGKYANVSFKVSNTMTENGSVKRGVCFEDNEHNLTRMVECVVERNKDKEIVCTPLEGEEPFKVSEEQPVSMNLFVFNKDLVISSAEATSNLACVDGIKYGAKEADDNYEDFVIQTRTKGFSNQIKRRLIFGSLALDENNYENNGCS